MLSASLLILSFDLPQGCSDDGMCNHGVLL